MADLTITPEILRKLEKAAELLGGFLDYNSLIEEDIHDGAEIERELNEAIHMIKNK